MTALAGFWHYGGRSGAAADCTRILAAQAIYGQDSAQWDGGPVALGRRLFRSLPEDRFDRRPIVGAGGDLVLVADARLDNRDDLARDLGLDYAVMCDAELLMRALERWGDDAVERFVGDFAFAAWDAKSRRLLLARDFLGQRPLHFHRGADFFAFASMPKGLHALADVPYAPDRANVVNFLALMPEAGTGTFFEGIERVEPGHIVSVTAKGAASRRYWRPSGAPLLLASPDEYAEALREKLDEAVRARLRSVAPVGAHLSAGFDSSAVAATAARLLAPSSGRMTAFTAVPRPGYDGPVPHRRLGDEGPLAAATAALYPNMEHVPISTEGRSPVDNLDRHFFLHDRPALNLCNGTWGTAINDAARQRGIGVMLTGQMGNMTISYGGEHLLPELLARGRLGRLAREIYGMLGHGASLPRVASQVVGPFVPARWWRAANALAGRGYKLEDYTAINPKSEAASAVAATAAERRLDTSYRPRRDGVEARLWVLGRFDPGNHNKGTLGGWGIDDRDPTADRRLVEFCLSVPAEQFMRGGVTRALARNALADRLPPEVLAERRKGYQAADWHEGLAASQAGLLEEIARLEATPFAPQALDLSRLAELAGNPPAQSWGSQAAIQSHRLALLRGVAVGHFLRRASRTNA